MLLKKMWSSALAGVFVMMVAPGCSRHPELAKTNEKGSSEWKRRQTKLVGQPDFILFSISAGNRIDTPTGEKVVQFGLSCGGFTPFMIQAGPGAEAESGDVKIGFDGAALAPKKWKAQGVGDFPLYAFELADADQGDFVRQLRHAGTFQLEFTPKGGKPQLSTFKLLNISSLIDQEESCKSALRNVR